jgi:hypothetical protein
VLAQNYSLLAHNDSWQHKQKTPGPKAPVAEVEKQNIAGRGPTPSPLLKIYVTENKR